MSNDNLHIARKVKNNEFYTRYEDIDKELKHYNLKGKSIYCNTDDYRKSNFVKYFVDNFNRLGIGKITATCFDNGDGAYMYQYDGINAIQRKLEGNGDFRSAECVELLKQSDVVVTNPPFSLFREYMAQLMEYGKKFLIVGNKNAITYKEIFPLIKENRLWLGISAPTAYSTPLKEVENEKTQYKENGVVYQKFGNHGWFTNIEHSNRIYPLDLYKRYDAEKYPKYDNYDAINVDKVTDIPCDYDDVMGMPISFLDKYCPTQFEIVWTTDRGGDGKIENLKNKNWDKSWDSPYINGEKIYKRVFIRRK